MDSAAPRALQEPFKQRYRAEPDSAMITLRVDGELGTGSLTCSVDTGRTLAKADLHPATGGDGIAACAGVTLRAAATVLEVPISRGTVHAVGDLDFRGTLGGRQGALAGFRAIRLRFALDTTASEEQLATLFATHRAVLRRLADPRRYPGDVRADVEQPPLGLSDGSASVEG